jgi:hypothetical protein
VHTHNDISGKMTILILILLGAVNCLVRQPTLDWDLMFNSLSIFVDDVYANEYTCVGNRSGHLSFLVFDIPLYNPSDSDMRLPVQLPYFNLSLSNASGLLAESSFQLAYLRDDLCPSKDPGFDNSFYGGLSAGCNVTVPKEIRCKWLEITELMNHTGILELSVLYNGESRSYSFEITGLVQHYRDAEISWLTFSLLLAAALTVVFVPSID